MYKETTLLNFDQSWKTRWLYHLYIKFATFAIHLYTMQSHTHVPCAIGMIIILVLISWLNQIIKVLQILKCSFVPPLRKIISLTDTSLKCKKPNMNTFVQRFILKRYESDVLYCTSFNLICMFWCLGLNIMTMLRRVD